MFSANNTLPAPKRHENVPETAQWLAGEGAGAWFCVRLFDQSKAFITQFDEFGNIECQSNFELLETDGFNEKLAFRVTYPAHCSIVTLQQSAKPFKFTRVT